MFGVVLRPAFRNIAALAVKKIQTRVTVGLTRNFSQLSIQPAKPVTLHQTPSAIQSHPDFLKLTANPSFTSQVRTVTKFSIKKGKRKTVKPALKRFKRLDWGIWIRTKSGRHKKLWKKSQDQRRRLRQHIFVNATQSWLLDKMATRFWRRPKHYVDDPYSFYHKRDNFERMSRKPREWDL